MPPADSATPPSAPGRSGRRVQRSVRATVAVLVLAFGGVVVAAALLHGGFVSLASASVIGWAAGATATRIVHNELQDSRRQHARDRADQAQAYAELAARRARENAAFASAMRQQVADHAVTIERLQGTLRVAKTRADLAEQAGQRTRVILGRSQQEVRDLRLRIDELEAERDGMLEALANARAEAALADSSHPDTRVVG